MNMESSLTMGMSYLHFDLAGSSMRLFTDAFVCQNLPKFWRYAKRSMPKTFREPHELEGVVIKVPIEISDRVPIPCTGGAIFF